MESTIRSRRSVHGYVDEPLSTETIEEIFEVARFAPSSYNLQPWEYLVLREEAAKSRLQECAYGQEHVTDAAATVVVLGNLDPAAHAERVFDDWLRKGYLPEESVRDDLVEMARNWRDRPTETNRIWTTKSAALGAMALMYAAWDRGIASCPMGGFDADAVREEFGTDGYEPVMLVTLGYPDEDCADLSNDRKFRRPVEEIVHFGSFDP